MNINIQKYTGIQSKSKSNFLVKVKGQALFFEFDYLEDWSIGYIGVSPLAIC